MSNVKRKLIAMRLPENIRKTIDRLAKKHGVTKTQIMVKAISEFDAK